MAAFESYSQLKTDLAKWLNRTDQDFTDYVPGFITLFETMANRVLRVREMETAADITFSGESAPLPTGYLAFRSLYFDGSPRRPLQYLTPANFYNCESGIQGSQDFYTIVGENILIRGVPANGSVAKSVYYKTIPALSDSNATNWLLLKHPDAYLYGCLSVAEPFLKNDDRIAIWKTFFAEVMQSIKMANDDDRFNAGPLVMQPDTVY